MREYRGAATAHGPRADPSFGSWGSIWTRWPRFHPEAAGRSTLAAGLDGVSRGLVTLSPWQPPSRPHCFHHPQAGNPRLDVKAGNPLGHSQGRSLRAWVMGCCWA